MLPSLVSPAHGCCLRFLQGDLSAAVSCAESLVSALASTSSASAVFDDPEGCSRFAAERVGGIMGVPLAEGVEQALAHLRKLLKLKVCMCEPCCGGGQGGDPSVLGGQLMHCCRGEGQRLARVGAC